MNGANLKVFIRVLFKHKILSLINLFGLAVGIAGCLLIVVYVTDELGYDAYHSNIDRIYRISTEFFTEGSTDHASLTSNPLGRELKHRYPEVEEAVRFNFGNEATIRYKDKLYKENSVWSADAGVFRVFSYNL